MADYEWEQKTLGQNKKIQEVVASAAKASELLNANMALAKGGVKAAQLFLTTVMNPKVIILNTIADAIDGGLLTDLHHLSEELGMHVLLETHSSENLQWIRELNPPIVGVNCRNLKTMNTNVDWFEEVYSQGFHLNAIL